ncbi:XrtA system polysaccharide chain length determinant [Desulfatitalea alkaliphila]|uniref:Wzz/FepE/Etk N-terminal domain-containing protein n=1 Tax=Desulfatitalea alkaliphila TaxID=2929485 RepID=A0AA41R301_9BACT|nr:XrtA system polysaccharide chain length determinant [Desulfatitalea alkaliphila]MCJ8502127.1 Wzz/FepE/Etk N-terminal domain-containing protein [Desulfatitalea alkaliphila]
MTKKKGAAMMSMPAKITPDLIIDMVVRRRWMILLPLAAALIVGIYLAFTMPRTYEAKTLILVEPQRVPEAFVRSIVTADPGERISTISQQIMSRTNLEKVISDFNLFSEPAQANMFMEDKIAAMRRQISVEVIRDRRGTDAFSIAFKGRDPELVTRVTNGLAGSFINANIVVRESQAAGTSEFLDAELTAMRDRLEILEGNIETYRRTNMGELPEQLDTNLRILDRLQENLSSRQQNLRDARARLSDLTNQASARGPSVVVIGGDRRGDEGGASLQELKAQLDAMRARYTERHPDIQRLIRQIEDLEAREAQRLAADDGSTPPAANVPIEVRAQVSEVRREIQALEREIDELQGQVAYYKRRIENTPRREQELLGLRRDYENIQASYNSLLARKIEADIAVNMERKQKGEQFRVVDPAQVPQRPIAPDVRKMFMMTMALGLAIGGGLVFLTEFVIKPSYRKPEDLEAEYGLPVITAIPRIMRRRDKVLKWANVCASAVFGVVVLGLVGLFGLLTVKGVEPVAALLQKIAVL